jgi:hypothetical protein
MERYHIAYFQDEEHKILQGVTLEAKDITSALEEFIFLYLVSGELKTKNAIKYIIKL